MDEQAILNGFNKRLENLQNFCDKNNVSLVGIALLDQTTMPFKNVHNAVGIGLLHAYRAVLEQALSDSYADSNRTTF